MTTKHTAQIAISTRDSTDEMPSPFIFLKFNMQILIPEQIIIGENWARTNLKVPFHMK